MAAFFAGAVRKHLGAAFRTLRRDNRLEFEELSCAVAAMMGMSLFGESHIN